MNVNVNILILLNKNLFIIIYLFYFFYKDDCLMYANVNGILIFSSTVIICQLEIEMLLLFFQLNILGSIVDSSFLFFFFLSIFNYSMLCISVDKYFC
jgi:hypothetical protein